MRFHQTLLLLSFLCFTISCGEDDGNVSVDPSNLQVSTSISDDGSGLVTIDATAENVTSFDFQSGEVLDQVDLVNSDGKFTYNYSETGIYSAVVRAYGESGRFVRKEIQISVEVGDGTIPDDGYTTPISYEGMELVWSDEFNQNSLNLSDWTYEIGTGSNGWGNNELQYYTENNTSVSNGYLTIEARQESVGGRSYSSSRIVTNSKQSFQYGRIDIRAKLPEGQGIWPALWMLGSNFNSVGWPSCGEIDIMEMIGGSGREKTVHGTVHWSNNGDYASYGGSYDLTSGIFKDEFHVFTIIWTENQIKWYVDDQEFNVIDITPSALSEFRQDFFFIFNVAVGGNWPGSPNAATTFPQQMIVDYVRVFQEE